MAETMNPWMKASSISYVIIAILNFIIVILKETSPKDGGFKAFITNFGGTFGLAHHLYGHIVLLLLLFIIFDLLFVYAKLNDSVGKLLKLEDNNSAAKYIIGSTILSAGVILVFMFFVAMSE